MIAQDFDPEYRATRIKELLGGADQKHTVESFKRIQLDDQERFAAEALPRLLDLVEGQATGNSMAVALLRKWDFRMDASRSEPLIFAGWMRQLLKDLLEDETGDLFRQLWGDRPNFLAAIAAGDPDASLLCDDIRTEKVKEDCRLIAARSLSTSLAELKSRFGEDMAKWRWGAAHRATFSHTPFGFVPVLSSLFGFSHEMGGGNSTVQRAAYRYSNSEPFAAVHGSGYRAIYDLGAEEKSLFMASTGQSGNVYSPYYSNLAPRWARGEYLPIRTNRDDIEARAADVLVLKPLP